jgi:hypothetical protein
MAHETIQIDRDELYERVWSEPVTTGAARLGLSDVGLAKICDKLNVPRPGRGYWVKKKHGRAELRPPLPPLKHVREPTATITKQDKPSVDSEQASLAETMTSEPGNTSRRCLASPRERREPSY